MSSGVVTQDATALKALIDATLRTLERDYANLRRATLAAPMDKPLPVGVFKLLATARRNLLVSFGKVVRLDAPEPAKQLTLTWLSLGATGLLASYRASAQPRSAAAARRRYLKRAQECYKKSTAVFAELDKALECPYGCKTP